MLVLCFIVLLVHCNSISDHLPKQKLCWWWFVSSLWCVLVNHDGFGPLHLIYFACLLVEAAVDKFFHGLDAILCNSVRLWVVWRWRLVINSPFFTEMFELFWGELRSSVTEDGLWQAIGVEDTDELFLDSCCGCLSSQIFYAWPTTELINHHKELFSGVHPQIHVENLEWVGGDVTWFRRLLGFWRVKFRHRCDMSATFVGYRMPWRATRLIFWPLLSSCLGLHAGAWGDQCIWTSRLVEWQSGHHNTAAHYHQWKICQVLWSRRSPLER